MKKILTIVAVVLVMMATLTNTYAADGIFSFGAFETAYRLSNNENINMPFINVFSNGATYDKEVKHSGISIGESTIDVNERLEGIHLIMSGDMVTIKGEVEHGIIYGKNIVVEGKISGDTILMAEIVKILETAEIAEDVIIVSNSLTMDGTIKGHLIGAISQAVINGTIEKDMRIDTTKVSLDNGNVGGNVYLRVPEGTDVTSVTKKYSNAVIETQAEDAEEIQGENMAKVIISGVKVVLIYTVIGLLMTRKETNVVTRATTRFTENSSFGILTGTAMLMLVFVLPVLLIILAFIGLGIVVWPILIVYLGIVLLSMSISSFVVGMTLYGMLKDRVVKFKIPVLMGIFVVIYAVINIPYISAYAWIAINLVSMSVIMSYIFKREEKVEVTIVETKLEDVKEKEKEEK